MKKKHLRALSSLENWLKRQNLITGELNSSLELLRAVVNSAPSDEDPAGIGALPLPVEISDEPMSLALYSDGGCRGNPGPGAWAYVVQDHSGQILAEGVEFEAYTTNNKMELCGPLRGLSEVREILQQSGREPLLTKVKVVTDSKYVVDGMKTWVQGWKGRGWKKADGKAPENLEFWQELDQVRNQFLEIEWVWVKGHGGHPQNEYCDRKANEVMDANIS